MNNIENLNKPTINLETRLKNLEINLPSVYEERLVDLCSKNPDYNDLNNVCSNLNFVLEQELWKKWVNFKQAILSLENPIWVS